MTQAVLRSAADSGAKAYDPIFYANEGITQLYKALGMAARVHRGYEKDPQAKGSMIQIKMPSTFTAQNAPSTAQDLTPGVINIVLDQWKEVKFALTDKELTLSEDAIITDHIAPAAYALADNIDAALCALYKGIPWYEDVESTPAVSDIVNCRKVLTQNLVPMNDPTKLHFMVDPTLEAGFLVLTAFSQHQGAGNEGVTTQRDGDLGRKFGFNFFMNQNVASHTKGTLSVASTTQSVGSQLAGATTFNFDDSTLTGTLVAGDVIEIAGHTQKYAVTATATAGSNAIAATIYPGLESDVANNTNVTPVLDNHTANLAFHSHAFALAMAPLSEMGDGIGARIATVTDPVTGLSLRSRVYYDGDNSKVVVALDVLYGVLTLDNKKAVRARG